jgi:hypothetical protein
MNISTEFKIMITILNRTENSSFYIHHSTFLHRLPRANFLFLDEKKQKSRAAEKKLKFISSGVK